MSLTITLEDITVSRAGTPLLNSVSWHLPSGGRMALLGGNGAGKSTLLRVARGEIWPDQLPGGGYAGRRTYALDGQESESPIGARERIGLAGADLRDLYRRRDWNISAWLVAVSGLTDSPLPSGRVDQASQEAAMAALTRLGAADLAFRPFLELSQGQAMAVLLARAVVRQPEWVFLDEAADGLDTAATRQLHALLERLSTQGVGLAVATHHPRSLAGRDFSALLLERGRVAFSGSLDEAAGMLDPERAHGAAGTRVRGLSPVTGGMPVQERPAGDSGTRADEPPLEGAGHSGHVESLATAGHPGREPSAAPPARSEPAGVRAMPDSRPDSASEGQRRETWGPPLLELSGVSLAFGGIDVLADITWSLLPGQHWAVFGPNGAGKSSMARLLAGDLHPCAGRITRFGLPEPASLWDLRARMGLVAWDIQAQYPGGTTVLDVLLSGFFGSFGLYDEPLEHMRAKAHACLDRLGLSPLAGRPFVSLSQGQARRIMIVRALIHGPEALLLDEPLGGLDPRARGEVLGLLDDLAVQGCQLVMITHNPGELPAAISHGLLLEKGRIVAQGPIEDVLGRFDT